MLDLHSCQICYPLEIKILLLLLLLQTNVPDAIATFNGQSFILELENLSFGLSV